MKLEDLDLSKSYTYADYLGWKFKESVELIRGKLFRMSPAPNRYHQDVSTNLLRRILYFFGDGDCKVYHAPFDVRLPLPPGHLMPDKIDTVVQPDILVVCDLSKLDIRGCQGPPDWIIEILSPKTAQKDTRDKFEVYEFSGVKEYWIVYPEMQNVYVYTLNDQGKYVGHPPYSKEDKIISTVFPDLVIDLDGMFPETSLIEEDYEEYIRM